MRLLVLGGTKFLGRAAVEAALERGHEVTLFNRGETNPELFPEAEKLRGDRDGDLSALEGREWDAVIDPSGFVPRVVRASAELLQSSIGHYVFVSSISVYREPYEPGFDEDAPVFDVEPATESVNEEYAELKAACERVLSEVLPETHASVRAGLIVGPHDPTGRFTYWPLRACGGAGIRPWLAPPDREDGPLTSAIPAPGSCDSWRSARQGRSTRFARRPRSGSCSRPVARRQEAMLLSSGPTSRSCSGRTSPPGWNCRSGLPATMLRSCRRMSPGRSAKG